ncbi:T-cell surface glycoprotein CD8 beta chain [Lonchura striata]|uniref:T-cell surface glycoprotein CD8 beta chain n=1 Tax=Lonchura striata TaxID=40157 RepID=A0A218V9N6_9PASE|nr:T-cell surface glycoprotein CD8 beta chain [Lonchura striata domestica]
MLEHGFYTTLLLTQTPGHILTQTNNQTEILCELKKEHTGVYWYRWSQERQHFEFLLFSNTLGKATYGPNVKQDKFSVHEARSQGSYSLHISHLHPSDSGTYYCSVSQSSQLLLGSGTQLTVGKQHPGASKMGHQYLVISGHFASKIHPDTGVQKASATDNQRQSCQQGR